MTRKYLEILSEYLPTKHVWLRIVVLAICITSKPISAQYLHRSGKQIVNGSGQEVILRSMGLGGWMLQEGYMLEMNSFANAQYQIRAKIADLIGETNTIEFYDAWHANHCTKRDIDSLASWGFNCVRLPMHYNLYTLPVEKEPVAGQHTWVNKGFAMTDSLLKWCAANQLYLILDLHATPGGQGKDAAISDYDSSKPSLWESEANKQKTIALWRKLAERYANEPWIGGYDLINETNWNFTPGANKNGCDETTNAPLKKLLMDITTAIREVDKNHIIYIEGNCWANNHRGLLPMWDDNSVLSFHKYWNYNDQGSLQGFLNTRDQYNLPLWLGESGENSNLWFTNAIRLMETNKVGWAWWPMKKVSAVTNPLTIVKNDGYEQLLNYWKNGGTKPSADVAKSTLMQLAINLRIENNIYRKDVIDAMFRQVYDASTKPFGANTVPGIIQASDYDLGRYNKAYYDKDTATYHVSAGAYTPWNNGWSYRNDGVDIQKSVDSDPKAKGHSIGWTLDGEWTQYTLDVDSSAVYTMNIRYSSSVAGSKIKVNVDGLDKASVDLPSTGGNSNWVTKTVNDIVLYNGKPKLKLIFEKGGANLSYVEFILNKKLTEVPLRAVAAQTLQDGQSIQVSVNKKIDQATIGKNGFSILINGSPASIAEVKADAGNTSCIVIRIDKALSDLDAIKVSYNGDAVQSADGSLLEDFMGLQVTNTLPVHYKLPGIIEAESFFVNHGLQLETTTDTGGGQNIGYTNTGDYLEYRIFVQETSEYTLDVRIACMSQAGRIEVQQLSKERNVLNNTIIEIPVTGGWQTWKTVSSKINLDSGLSILKVKILQPEFNINWFKFSETVINGVDKKRQGSLRVYPNPVQQHLNIELPELMYDPHFAFRIRNLTGKIIEHQKRATIDELTNVFVGDLPSGLYIIELEMGGKLWNNKFIVR